MRKAFCIFVIALVIFVAFTTNSVYSSTVIMGMKIGKQVYNVNEPVSITGNLTEDGVIVNNSTVAVQINTLAGTPFIFRTLSTGVNSTQGFFKVVILDVHTQNSIGQGQTLFYRGNLAYVSTTVLNNDTLDHPIKVALYIQYSDNSPFVAYYAFVLTIQAGQEIEYITTIPIPQNAVSGETTIFASLFTDDPSAGGVPYCLEKRALFYIQSTTPHATPQPPYFDMFFKIPKYDAKLGNYTVYARAEWRLHLATNIQSFKVMLLGDLYKDGRIDMRDIGVICTLYGTKEGDARWNPEADLNGDKVVNMRDVGTECANFGATGT